MASQTDRPRATDPKELWIFLNDFTDSDNEAAGLAWAYSLDRHPERKGIYIAEPRHVNLGYYMTSADFGRCIGLVSKLYPRLEDSPLTTVLAGRITPDIINNSQVDEKSPNETEPKLRALNEEERKLLERCIRPRNGAKEDAITHARLLTMDFLSTMKTCCQRPFDVYVDNVALSYLESPINLKTHYHEELLFRTADELEKFQDITAMPIDSDNLIENRRNELRKWYDKAVERKLGDFSNENPLKDLTNYNTLFDEMRKHEPVVFFGGCSLTILQEILKQEPTLAKKVHYYQQGGTFNSKLNILGNPLNFALNTKAAEFVFHKDQIGKLANFTLIPTDTTKKLEFTTKSLKDWSAAIGLHTLGFYGRMDPWDLVTPDEHKCARTEDLVSLRSALINTKYDDPKFRGYKAVMADLVAFLVSFTSAFDNYKTPQGFVRKRKIGVAMRQPIEGSNQLVLAEDKSSPIKALLLDIPNVPGQDSVLVEDTLTVIQTALMSA